MGLCSSCERSSNATAKLILLDGELLEFSSPTKVSRVLENRPECFICDSHEIDFDKNVMAIEDDKELQPGQLYFALPLSWLSQRLQAEDMASLAVKACSALAKSTDNGYKCGCCGILNRVDPLIFLDFKRQEKSRKAVADDDAGREGLLMAEKILQRAGAGALGGGRDGRVRGRKFTSKLSIILEE